MTRRTRGHQEPYAVVEATVTCTVELPPHFAQTGVACDDPAIEAVIEALGRMVDVYLWGIGEAPARVTIEACEDDCRIEEDHR